MSRYGNYTVKGSGINSRGNLWESRDYGPSAPNPNAYRYANENGSWYYRNPDNSRYHDNGRGRAVYTDPSGGRHDMGHGGGRNSDRGSTYSRDSPNSHMAATGGINSRGTGNGSNYGGSNYGGSNAGTSHTASPSSRTSPYEGGAYGHSTYERSNCGGSNYGGSSNSGSTYGGGSVYGAGSTYAGGSTYQGVYSNVQGSGYRGGCPHDSDSDSDAETTCGPPADNGDSHSTHSDDAGDDAGISVDYHYDTIDSDNSDGGDGGHDDEDDGDYGYYDDDD